MFSAGFWRVIEKRMERGESGNARRSNRELRSKLSSSKRTIRRAISVKLKVPGLAKADFRALRSTPMRGAKKARKSTKRVSPEVSARCYRCAYLVVAAR